MQSISHETAKEKKLIRFHTPGEFLSTTEAFYIADGDSIRITNGTDGQVRTYACRFIDLYHMYVGSSVFHIDEFSEILGRSGSRHDPVNTLTDLSLYVKKYCDPSLINEEGKKIPYREIIHVRDPQNYANIALSISVCPEADSLRTACIIKRKGDFFEKEFLPLLQLQNRLYGNLWSELNPWDRQTLYAVLSEIERVKAHPKLQDQIHNAKSQLEPVTKEREISAKEVSR